MRAVLSSVAMVLAMVKATPADAADQMSVRALGPDEPLGELPLRAARERRTGGARAGSGSSREDSGARKRAPYPIDGPHSYGDGFGDRPNHQGADILSACGTPLRAVKAGTVRRLATEGSAGRYIVLRDGEGREYVYMHMSDVAVSSGERVRAGERVGSVGQTGNASTCHLHFEAWSAPGWYAGGSPHDPMPVLRPGSSS
jgi:murein DD-endopeptidase MepM/ murein hydrolase activator NlpD